MRIFALSVICSLMMACSDTSAAQDTSFIMEELNCTRDDKTIRGTVFIPKADKEEFATVIISHGLFSTRERMIPYAEIFASRGIVCYCFDFSGGHPSSASDGEITEMSVFTQQADLNAVIDMIKQQDYVDKENLFLLGRSQGGFVSAITASQRPDEFRGVILHAPAFIIPDAARERYNTIEDIPEYIPDFVMPLGRIYFESVFNYNVYEHIGGYTGDVLIIHGDVDESVPLRYSEKALQHYRSAKLEVLPGMDHFFSGGYFNESAELSYKFISEHIVTK